MRVWTISPYTRVGFFVCDVCLDAVKQNVGGRMFSEMYNF